MDELRREPQPARGAARRAQPAGARFSLETYVTHAVGLAQSSLGALTISLIKHKPKATASPVANLRNENGSKDSQ